MSWLDPFGKTTANDAQDAYREKFGTIDFSWVRVVQLPDYDEKKDHYIQMILDAIEAEKRLSDEDFGLEPMPDDCEY